MKQCVSCLQVAVPEAVGRGGRNKGKSKGKGSVADPAGATTAAPPADSSLATAPPATPLNAVAAREGGGGVYAAPTPTSAAAAGDCVWLCVCVCSCLRGCMCLPHYSSPLLRVSASPGTRYPESINPNPGHKPWTLDLRP